MATLRGALGGGIFLNSNFLLRVPANNKFQHNLILAGTGNGKVKVLKKFPNPLKAPLSAAPKVPEFCPEVEGIPVSRGEPVVCNIPTLDTELSLLGLFVF